MAKRDYYEILGVDRNVSEKDLKKAYRRMAMKYHPDRNPGDSTAENNFKEVNEAFEVLSDPQKREAYNQFGHEGVNHSGGSGGGFGNFGDIFSDIFGDIFGDSRGSRRTSRGRDLQLSIEMSLEEVATGISKTIRVPSHDKCSSCNGSGAKKGAGSTTCPTCNGRGKVQMQQAFFAIQQTCPKCQGSGKFIKDICRPCNGKGVVPNTKEVTIKIPAGIEHADRIRLSGQGDSGNLGDQPGDLYIVVQIKQHPIFGRDGSNLYCEIPIPFISAVLGDEIEIPTLNGLIKLKIPPETQNGKMFRLRGKGLPESRYGSFGDLLCKINIEIPVKLSEHQKKLLQELQKSIQLDKKQHCPQNSEFFKKVKKFLLKR